MKNTMKNDYVCLFQKKLKICQSTIIIKQNEKIVSNKKKMLSTYYKLKSMNPQLINNIQKMNIQQSYKSHQLKKTLSTLRQQKIQKRVLQKQRQKININNNQYKKYEKYQKVSKKKIIKKKIYDTYVQKGRKILDKVQDNQNAGTYVSESQEYLKILSRTKNYVKFDREKLQEGCKAISAYGNCNNQNIITIQLTMQNSIQCHPTPIILHPIHSQSKSNCIILTNNSHSFQQKVKHSSIDMQIMTIPQLIKNRKQPKKQKIKKQIKIFCDFKIFSTGQIIYKLFNNNIIVFPIDLIKIPFVLQQQIKVYQQYLEMLAGSNFALIKSGKFQRVKIENRQSCQLVQNVESITHQFVARLIQKNKAKGNRLICVKISTGTSIPIIVYQV